MSGGVPLWALLVFAAATGLTAGSFVAAESRRLILGDGGGTRSRCRHCRCLLGLRDLAPVLSYLACKGRCRRCGEPIGWRYPATESACAVIFVAMAALCGTGSLACGPMSASWTWPLLAVALLLAAVTDLEAGFVPDRATVAVAGLGGIAAVIGGESLLPTVVSGLAAFAAAWGLRAAYRWLRRLDGLGFGDVKLIGAAGLWLPGERWPLFLILAGVFGVLTAILLARSWTDALGRRVPFAPAIGAALLVSLSVPAL